MDEIKHIISRLIGENDEEDSNWKDLANEPPDDPFERWSNTYKPVLNETNPHASFDGTMFETYGPELEFVRSSQPDHVWTYVTGDNNEDIIVAGFHFVNRMGYFITEFPWKDESEAYQFGDGDSDEEEEEAE